MLLPECSFDKTLLAFALLHLYSKTKLAYYFRYLLPTSYFSISIPCDEKDILKFFSDVSSISFVGFHRTSQLRLLQYQ